MPEMADYMERTGGPDGQGPHPLGTNWEQYEKNQLPGFDGKSVKNQLLVLRDGVWQPGACQREGHYHKLLDGKWVSFYLKTTASVSASQDEFFLKAEFTNRTDRTLVLTVLPIQNIANPYVLNTYEQTARPGFSVMEYEDIVYSSSADCAEMSEEGWVLRLPAGEAKTIRISVRFAPGLSAQPYDPQIRDRIEAADRSVCKRLADAFSNLPSVHTDLPLFDLYYKRSILTVLESTWRREDYVLNPFYSCGTWMSTLAWDTSFSSKMLALTEPEGLRQAIRTYVGSDVLRSSYINYLGNNPPHAYLQTLFAAIKTVDDYILITGDRGILSETVPTGTILKSFQKAYDELFDAYLADDGLLDFGAVSNHIVEIRTDGYKHKVSGINGIAAHCLLTLATWWDQAGDTCSAALCRERAEKLAKAMNQEMWDERTGWFSCLYPDGSRHQVAAYHLFDFIASPLLSQQQRQAMIAHIREGDFLGKYGMYSISKQDKLHYDCEDIDWGGGGQYIGMPNRIAESLYQLGYVDKGWEILSRCIRWCEGYPYFPQEIFTERLSNPPYEMPLEISGGGGMQAILFGVFGLRPQNDRSLIIQPAYHIDLGEARMRGFVFAGHRYDIELGCEEYRVYRDGLLAVEASYGTPSVFEGSKKA